MYQCCWEVFNTCRFGQPFCFFCKGRNGFINYLWAMSLGSPGWDSKKSLQSGCRAAGIERPIICWSFLFWLLNFSQIKCLFVWLFVLHNQLLRSSTPTDNRLGSVYWQSVTVCQLEIIGALKVAWGMSLNMSLHSSSPNILSSHGQSRAWTQVIQAWSRHTSGAKPFETEPVKKLPWYNATQLLFQKQQMPWKKL